MVCGGRLADLVALFRRRSISRRCSGAPSLCHPLAPTLGRDVCRAILYDGRFSPPSPSLPRSFILQHRRRDASTSAYFRSAGRIDSSSQRLVDINAVLSYHHPGRSSSVSVLGKGVVSRDAISDRPPSACRSGRVVAPASVARPLSILEMPYIDARRRRATATAASSFVTLSEHRCALSQYAD